jgi:hypothetical protein
VRRLLLFLVLLVAALPVLGDVILSPPAPNDETPVTLQVRSFWRDSCLPTNPVLTRTAGKVEILYTVPESGGCRTAFTPWNRDIALGALEAGQWEIAVKVKEREGSIETHAQLSVAVTDASPAFRIDPPILRSGEPRGVRLVMLQDTAVLCSPVPANIFVRVNGVTVPSMRTGCILHIELPALPPGGTDVELRADAKSFYVRSAIRVVDPNVPDPNVFQRILIPVLYEGPGGFGSQWTTEAAMTNWGGTGNQGHELEPVLEVSKPLPVLLFGEQTPSLISLFGNHGSGLLLFVPHGQDVRFGNVIRDTSRDASQFGTEVPVVREEDTDTFIELTNIPFDPRFRLQLRIYGLEGVGFTVDVKDKNGQGSTVELNGPCTGAQMPCNSNQPAYASVDLRAIYPSLKEGRLRIGISSRVPNRKLWAFVTVTNNDTQDVTVISPQ